MHSKKVAAIIWAATFFAPGQFRMVKSFPHFLHDIVAIVRVSDQSIPQSDAGVRIIPIPEGISAAQALAAGVRALPDDVDEVLLYDGDEPSADPVEVLHGVGGGWCVAVAEMPETVKIV